MLDLARYILLRSAWHLVINKLGGLAALARTGPPRLKQRCRKLSQHSLSNANTAASSAFYHTRVFDDNVVLPALLGAQHHVHLATNCQKKPLALLAR